MNYNECDKMIRKQEILIIRDALEDNPPVVNNQHNSWDFGSIYSAAIVRSGS